MPNWCECTLTVEGPNQDADNFIARVSIPEKELNLSFETTVPTPENLLTDKSETRGVPTWYWWRLQNWGTKWDTESEQPPTVDHNAQDVTTATYHFDTAWDPPSAWLIKTSSEFPRLTFYLEFDEPGMDFWGVISVQDGIIMESEEGPSKINENIVLEECNHDEEILTAFPEPDFSILIEAGYHDFNRDTVSYCGNGLWCTERNLNPDAIYLDVKNFVYWHEETRKVASLVAGTGLHAGPEIDWEIGAISSEGYFEICCHNAWWNGEQCARSVVTQGLFCTDTDSDEDAKEHEEWEGAC